MFFFSSQYLVRSRGMSNVHTGIENTSQGGVSRGWAGEMWWAVGRMGWASKYSLVFVTIKGGIQEIPFIFTYKWGYVCIFSEVLGDFFLLVLQKMAGT